jgi:predicted ester cyclase
MPAEELKDTLREVLESAYNAGDLEAMGRLYAPDVVYHRPPMPDIEGCRALMQYVAELRCAFSSVHLTLEEIVVEGEMHATRWTFRGMHTGRSPSMPVPPTGREVTMSGCSVSRSAEGRITEEWSHADWLSLFRQLGVIPPMG